jgi:DNA-binding transcriptional LysR family regulator
LELHQLRYLRAVVRSGSVTRAAELEHIAQPSVSRQLKLLERELGVPLFHRVGRGVLPTDAALELADLADRLFDDLAATTTAITARDDRAPATLRICATETVADHLLPPALTEILPAYPNVAVSVEMLGTVDAVQRVLADEADLAIVVLPLADARILVEPLFHEAVLLLLNAGDPAARLAAVPLAQALARSDLLLSMRGLGLRAQVDEAAALLGIDVESRVEMRSQRALIAMVAAGAGAALAPAVSLAAAPAGTVSRALDPPLRREIGWVRRRGRHLPAPAFALLDAVRQAHARLVSGLFRPSTSGASPPTPSGSSA